MTQCERILEFLKSRGEYGATRLEIHNSMLPAVLNITARISELRQTGARIIHKIILRNGKKIDCYFLKM
jgi:hypothetical protein